MGNHSVSCNGEAVKTYTDDVSVLAHFPIRHPEQFASKIIQQIVGLDALPSRNPGWGTHLAGAFNLLVNRPDVFFDQFYTIAKVFDANEELDANDISFVCDPVSYRGGGLDLTGDVPSHYALTFTIMNALSLARVLATSSVHSS